MNINIKIILHNKHRYPTVGDWWFDQNGTLHIRVSEMKNSLHEQLVAFHEQIEALLCSEEGIDQDDVTRFDEQFERDRVALKWSNEREPGDDMRAPYYKQHQIATAYERMMAVTLGVNWQEYSEEIQSL